MLRNRERWPLHSALNDVQSCHLRSKKGSWRDVVIVGVTISAAFSVKLPTHFTQCRCTECVDRSPVLNTVRAAALSWSSRTRAYLIASSVAERELGVSEAKQHYHVFDFLSFFFVLLLFFFESPPSATDIRGRLKTGPLLLLLPWVHFCRRVIQIKRKKKEVITCVDKKWKGRGRGTEKC